MLASESVFQRDDSLSNVAFDMEDLNAASRVRLANPIRDYLVKRGHVLLLVFLDRKEHAMCPKHMQLCRPLDLHSLLSGLKAYLFGGPSLSAVGDLLHRGTARGFPLGSADSGVTVRRRNSRNALNVTHFGISLGSVQSCRSVRRSTAELFGALPRPQNLELYLGWSRVAKGRYAGRGRKNKQRITRNHLGIYLETFCGDGHEAGKQ